MHNDYWTNKLTKYAGEPWSSRHSIFADEVAPYFPAHSHILELGSGLGRDGAYFESCGYSVTMSDLEKTILESNYPEIKSVRVDMSRPLSFPDATYDVVYAHQAIHYFSDFKTRRLIGEIYRVLRPGGVVALLVNSSDDPENGMGEQLENNYRLVDGLEKRFFTLEYMSDLMSQFDSIILDKKGESRKDSSKDIHGLIRYIGRRR